MKVLRPWPRDLASKVVDPRVDTMTEAGAQSASPWDRGKPSMCHVFFDGRQPKPCESSSESWMKVVHGSFQSNLRAPHFLVSFNIVHFFHIFSTLTVRQPYCQLTLTVN